MFKNFHCSKIIDSIASRNSINFLMIENSYNTTTQRITHKQKLPPITLKAQNKVFQFFLFFNPRSGNAEGSHYSIFNEEYFTYHYENRPQIAVKAVNLLQSDQVDIAMQSIKQKTQIPIKNHHLRLIISGGDGTVMWVIDLAKKYQLNFDKIIFGIMPIGTGNQLARSLGWALQSLHISPNNIEMLKNLFFYWTHAPITDYDVWDIQVEVYPGGFIEGGIDTREIQLTQNILKKTFINFVGFGLDAKISYDVGKTKTSNICLTKCKYFWRGVFNCILGSPSLEDMIETFQQSQDSLTATLLQEKKSLFKNKTEGILPCFRDKHHTTEQLTDNYKQLQMVEPYTQRIWSQVLIKEGYRGLICLNTSSHSDGNRKMWKTSYIGRQSTRQTKHFHPQACNDGVIEFIGYKNQLGLGLERWIRMGSKIAQGKGPFQIKMKVCKQNERVQSYIHIDGEGFKIINLKSYKISKSTINEKGMIKLMLNTSVI